MFNDEATYPKKSRAVTMTSNVVDIACVRIECLWFKV